MTIISDTSKNTDGRASLGNITKFASTSSELDKDRAIFERYWLQFWSRKLLPNERIKICHRYRVSPSQGVDVKRSKSGSKAGFSNLMRCQRLWQCPVCATVISEHRRQELRQALSIPTYSHALVTYTVSHGIGNSFKSTHSAISAAYRDFHAGRWYKTVKNDYGIVGSVRTHEITHGKNGWHPHIHELLFSTVDASMLSSKAMENLYIDRWTALVGKYGYYASREHGIDISTESTRLAEYISKHGRLPAELRWSVAEEVTKAVTKRTKSDDSTTPFGLLERFADGDETAGKLFVEYVEGTKGSRHLRWSAGLKKLLGIGEVKDSEILEHETDDYDVLTSLTGEEWIVVKRNNLQSNILIYARKGDIKSIHNLIQKHMERM